MKHLEFEARSIISKESFNKLLDKYSSDNLIHASKEQTNIYFDNSSLDITNNNEVLRIRSYVGKETLKLTYKAKSSIYNGDLEITQVLSKNDLYNIERDSLLPSGPVKEALKGNGYEINDIFKCGEITTKRHEFKVDDYLVVLDENIYSGLTDYNIEIESNNLKYSKDLLNSILIDSELENSIVAITKSKRAIEQYLLNKKKA